MIFTTVLEKIKELRETREAEPTLKNETVIGLVKIKKNLLDNKHKTVTDSVYLTITDINPDLKPFREISKELRNDGFLVTIYDAEEDLDAYLNTIFTVDLIIEKNSITKDHLNSVLNQSLDKQLQKLGIDLDIVNNEITNYKPSYENIMNGVMVKKESQNNSIRKPSRYGNSF